MDENEEIERYNVEIDAHNAEIDRALGRAWPLIMACLVSFEVGFFVARALGAW